MLLTFLWFGLVFLSLVSDIFTGMPFHSSSAALSGAASGLELALTIGVQENLRIMFNPLTVLMLLGVLAVCALLWLRVGGRPDVKRLGPYLLCALLNHSAEHAFFTYRALCVTIFAAVSMAIPTGKAET